MTGSGPVFPDAELMEDAARAFIYQRELCHRCRRMKGEPIEGIRLTTRANETLRLCAKCRAASPWAKT